MSRASSIIALAFAGLLAGCMTVGEAPRHLVPLPADLVAEMREKGMTPADPILIRIFKEESELEVWKRDRTGRFAHLRTYPICRWSGQLGPKTRTGDRQAPEGFYTVRRDLMNPASQFHLAFNLGFPNPLERELGHTGSALMVHGACSSSGCYAMGDRQVEEIYALAREAFSGGMEAFQVQALPFRMTAENMARHRYSAHMPFWRNLREGALHFEATRRPPVVAHCGGRYVFDRRASDPAARFAPGEPCPDSAVEPAVASAVAPLKAEQDRRVASLIAAGAPAVRVTYADGGMHEHFRRILRMAGPVRLQQMTSARVEVSRPDAALSGASEVAIASPADRR